MLDRFPVTLHIGLVSFILEAVVGGGIQNVIIAMSVVMIPGYARVMHGHSP